MSEIQGFSTRLMDLRKAAGKNQDALGADLGLTKSGISSFEKGKSFPSPENLVKLSRLFGVSVDYLLTGADHAGEGTMSNSDIPTKKSSVLSGASVASVASVDAIGAYHGPTVRVLTVDHDENRAAPFYNFKTAASYLSGYNSQERPEPEGYLSMPRWLLKNGDYAIFPVIGDSMEPTFFSGDYAVCRAIHRGQWSELAADTVACIVSESRGLQLKRIKQRPAEHLIRCKSDNRTVPAFNLPMDEVLEIWRFEWRLSANASNLADTVFAKVDKLEDDVSDLRELLESVIDVKELKRLQSRKTSNDSNKS